MPHAWPTPRIDEQPWSTLEESRPVAIVCTRSALAAVRHRLRLPVASTWEVQEADLASWDAAVDTLRGEVIYAVGGGLATDAAKHAAVRLHLPLVSLPTALSVDAFFTWASGVRGDGCVRYIETRPPERVVVDYDVWRAAPLAIRAGGICDVLSIATGLWDWHHAHQRGLNPPHAPYIPWVADVARGILRGSLECAEAAGRGDTDGLRSLLHALATEVMVCNLIGHPRPEEGSEHYFAYSVENRMGKGLPHGDLVGPGILLMAALQGQAVEPLREALHACHIPLRNIPEPVVRETLADLPRYAARHGLAHGIAHEITGRQARELDVAGILGGA
jgi:glycerol-1-phosphate dehydrogenase [NAD(P)+]